MQCEHRTPERLAVYTARFVQILYSISWVQRVNLFTLYGCCFRQIHHGKLLQKSRLEKQKIVHLSGHKSIYVALGTKVNISNHKSIIV